MNAESFLNVTLHVIAVAASISIFTLPIVIAHHLLMDVKRDTVTGDSVLYVVVQALAFTALPIYLVFSWHSKDLWAYVTIGGMALIACAAWYGLIDLFIWARKTGRKIRVFPRKK